MFQAMRPVFGDLLTELQRSIGYFTSIDRSAKISRIMALGNAIKLPGLRQAGPLQVALRNERIDQLSQRLLPVFEVLQEGLVVGDLPGCLIDLDVGLSLCAVVAHVRHDVEGVHPISVRIAEDLLEHRAQPFMNPLGVPGNRLSPSGDEDHIG